MFGGCLGQHPEERAFVVLNFAGLLTAKRSCKTVCLSFDWRLDLLFRLFINIKLFNLLYKLTIINFNFTIFNSLDLFFFDWYFYVQDVFNFIFV